MFNPRTRTTLTQLQKTTTEIINTIINENVANCSIANDLSQRIILTAGDNSTINLDNISMNAKMTSNLACLLTAKLSSEDITKMNQQFQADLKQSTIKFPDIMGKTTRNTSIVQEWNTRMTSQISFKNIINAFQNLSINQEIIVKAGNNSTITLTKAQLEGTLESLTKIINDNVLNIATVLDQSFTADASIASTEENALKPFADVTNNLIDTVGDTVSKGVDAATSVFTTGMIVWVIVIIVVLVAVYFMKDTILAGLKQVGSVTPAGRALGVKAQ